MSISKQISKYFYKKTHNCFSFFQNNKVKVEATKVLQHLQKISSYNQHNPNMNESPR
jgi:hypothetical protein